MIRPNGKEKPPTRWQRIIWALSFNPWLTAELEKFPDIPQRLAAMKQASRVPWFNLGLFLLIALLSAFGVEMVGCIVHQIPLVPKHRFVVFAFCMLFAIAMGLLWGFIFRRPMRRRLRLELIKAGQPVCLGCGYDLRGLVDQRCPECGLAFDLRKPPYADSSDQNHAQ